MLIFIINFMKLQAFIVKAVFGDSSRNNCDKERKKSSKCDVYLTIMILLIAKSNINNHKEFYSTEK